MSHAYDHYREGQRYLADGDTVLATAALEQAKLVEPAKASIREALGIAYFRIGCYADAEREFRALLELAPTNDYGHYVLARCLTKRGAMLEARRHVKLASSLRPGNADYRRAADALQAAAN